MSDPSRENTDPLEDLFIPNNVGGLLSSRHIILNPMEGGTPIYFTPYTLLQSRYSINFDVTLSEFITKLKLEYDLNLSVDTVYPDKLGGRLDILIETLRLLNPTPHVEDISEPYTFLNGIHYKLAKEQLLISVVEQLHESVLYTDIVRLYRDRLVQVILNIPPH